MAKFKITWDEWYPVFSLEEPDKFDKPESLVDISPELEKEFDEALDVFNQVQEKLKKLSSYK